MFRNHIKNGVAAACVGATILLGCLSGLASAQTSPEEIRQVLGKPVDIEKSVVFGANRSTFKELCKEEFEFEGHASVISRLEYGSLDAADQDLYRQMLVGQVRSNKTIFDTLDDEGKQEFCFGVRRNLLAYAADFVEAHPTLFKETEPKPKPKEKPYLDQIADELDGQDEAFQLYIVRLAENRIGEDMKRIFAFPGNESGSGLTWVFKVTATKYRLLSMITEGRFPDISQAYRERSDI